MDMRSIAVAALCAVALLFASRFLLAPSGAQEPVSAAEFAMGLSSAKKVFIIMDLRNSSESSRVPIMSCGVDLAGSIALAPKNLSIMVIDSGKCIFDGVDKPVFYCDDAAASGGAVLQVVEGANTTFYRNRAVIGIKSYDSAFPCNVTVKN